MQLKYSMVSSTFVAIAGVSAFYFWPSSSQSAPDAFSLCDGQSGVALGLCQGGVAAGCDHITDNVTACSRIEEKYYTATGGYDAPWIYLRYPVQTLSGQYGHSIDLETGEKVSFGYFPPPLFDLRQDFDIDNWDHYDEYPNDNPWTLRTWVCRDESDPRQVARYAVLQGVQFEMVTTAHINSASFSEATEPLTWLPPVGSGDTIIWNTCRDNYFKIGNLSCFEDDSGRVHLVCNDNTLPDYSWKFQYQMLSPAR